ncbi:hypothetical protein J6A31_04890 [bacterium]|nr:hypothetical protein [bacterium]
MSLKPTYDYIVGYKYVYDDELKTTVLREYHNRYIKQEFVIIDNLGRIFNYTEMINELRAHCNGVKINFGIGKTYSGDAYTEPKQRWYPYFCGGHYTSKGSGSSRLAVNKAERIANNSNLNDEYYGDIADEIEENLNVTINLRDIKTVYNSMKNKRRMLADKGWGSVYSEQFCKYGRPENWKNHKKSKQWKHNHDVTKQTARKDSMRKYIDEEYYFDYELDDCG